MPKPNRPIAAALWMIGSITGFTALAVAGREIARAPMPLDTFEMMFYRSAVGFPLVVLGAAALGKLGEIDARNLRLHALRNAVHFAGQNFWLYALALIPLAQLSAVEFSYPLMVALAAPLLLGERLRAIRVVAALVGFCGILMVARPFGPEPLSAGLIAAFLAAIGFAGAAILTKRLTALTPVVCILFWITLMQTVFGLICAGWDGDFALPSVDLLPWVLLLGASGIGAHVGLTMALSLAPASVVTPIDFLRLPVIGTVGALLYHETIDIWVVLGGAVILAANWINIAAERQRGGNTG